MKTAYIAACLAGSSIAPPVYVPPPLPAAAVEYWDCRKGITFVNAGYPKILSWAGQLRGTLVSQPVAAKQPTLAYDDVLSGRAPIVRFARASSQTLATQAEVPPLTLTGTRPWFYAYFRYRDPAVGQVSINYLSDWPSGTLYGAGMLYIRTAGKLTADFYSNPEFDVPVADLTAPLRAEGYIRTTDGALACRLNGVESTYGSGCSATAPTKAVQFAGNYGGNAAEMSLAFSMVASAVPSGAELSALYTWTVESFGGPPLLAAAVDTIGEPACPST